MSDIYRKQVISSFVLTTDLPNLLQAVRLRCCKFLKVMGSRQHFTMFMVTVPVNNDPRTTRETFPLFSSVKRVGGLDSEDIVHRLLIKSKKVEREPSTLLTD